ncbi:MAG: hypothetical protein H7061_11185 [Bdellovibrionaceae bacterium]|nr:hypothetical protein [Bdellovibrio sp.]
MKKSIKTLFLLSAAFFFLNACTPQSDRFYTEAYSEIEKGHFRVALDLLERSAQTAKQDKKRTKAMVEAARIARFEIQDYNRALRLNREIVMKSEDPKQRLNAQLALGEIYLENTQNYAQALKEFLILEQLEQNLALKERLKFKIAQAQFLIGNPKSSLEYIDSALKLSGPEKKNFLKLRAQVLISEKKFDEAIAAYADLLTLDEPFFNKENLYIATSIAYEEKEDYAAALAYLQTYKDRIQDKAYLELRIKRLSERLTNKPLFKGRRK